MFSLAMWLALAKDNSSHAANRFLKIVCIVGHILSFFSSMRRACPAGPLTWREGFLEQSHRRQLNHKSVIPVLAVHRRNTPCSLHSCEQETRLGVLPIVRVPGRERRLLETMQLAIGEFITDSSQGLPPSPRVWGRKAPSPSSLRYLLDTIISWCKWIGYTVGSWCKRIGYTVGSWCKRIGYTVARQFFVGFSAFPW